MQLQREQRNIAIEEVISEEKPCLNEELCNEFWEELVQEEVNNIETDAVLFNYMKQHIDTFIMATSTTVSGHYIF